MLLGLLLVLSGVCAGCGGPGDAGPVEIRVAAASDLQAAMPELAAAFERESGIRVVPVLGSSGQLARQVEQGAPYDVFLSANREYVRRLVDAGAVLPDSVRPYARGPLVLAFSRSAGAGLSGLDALADPSIRSIALANPDHAPYGVAARQALDRAGLWDEVESRVVLGRSIQNAAQFVRSGQAEAGLIARSLADDPALRWEAIDPGLHDPIDQYLGVVAGRDEPASARAFCGFLLGDPGQAILARFGFEPAGSVGSRGSGGSPGTD